VRVYGGSRLEYASARVRIEYASSRVRIEHGNGGGSSTTVRRRGSVRIDRAPARLEHDGGAALCGSTVRRRRLYIYDLLVEQGQFCPKQTFHVFPTVPHKVDLYDAHLVNLHKAR